MKTPDGEDHVLLSTVEVSPSPAASVFQHSLRKRFTDGPVMEGVDFDTSAGLDARVYVHWQLPALGGPWTETLLGDGQAFVSRQLAAVPGGGHVSTAIDVVGDPDSLQVTVQDRARAV